MVLRTEEQDLPEFPPYSIIYCRWCNFAAEMLLCDAYAAECQPSGRIQIEHRLHAPECKHPAVLAHIPGYRNSHPPMSDDELFLLITRHMPTAAKPLIRELLAL